MKHKFENLITGEENLLDFLDKAVTREVEDLKDYIKDYYKHDVLARRAISIQIENYYYGRKLSD